MALPTVITRTVGTGKTHATITLWEDTTDYDLVAANVIEVGEVYADSVFNEAVVLAGATTDPGHFRVLMAAPGHAYDPITGTGVRVTAGAAQAFVGADDYGVVEGAYFESSHTSAVMTPTGVLHYLHRCTFKSTIAGNSASLVGGTAEFSTFCVGIGIDATNGARRGWSNSANSARYRCVCYKVSNATSGAPVGINTGQIIGCVSTDCGGADYAGTPQYSSSSDATATGTGSITGITAAAAFRNAAANDFRPPTGAPTIDKGVPFVPPFKPLAMALAVGHSLNTGLVLACPFADRVANVSSDISGLANHITLAAGAGDAAWSRHFPGATVSMDGGAAVPMTVAQTSGLPLYTATSHFSVSMWVLTTTIAAGTSPIWVEDSSSTSGWYRLSRSTATLALEILDDAGANILASTSGGTLVANRWHHIAIVDAAGSVAVYLDGVRVINATYTRVAITDLTLTTPFNALTGTAFVGRCTDIRLASRAWTAGEIRELSLTNPWAQYGGEPPTDFAGHTIPQGASLDMGAYEATLAGPSFAEGSRWAAMGRGGGMPSPLLPRDTLPPYPSERKQQRR